VNKTSEILGREEIYTDELSRDGVMATTEAAGAVYDRRGDSYPITRVSKYFVFYRVLQIQRRLSRADLERDGFALGLTAGKRLKETLYASNPLKKFEQSLESMQIDDVLLLAMKALHALNRTAKHCRDAARASFWDCDEDAECVASSEQRKIYALKDEFLLMLAETGQAKVETFHYAQVCGWKCACGHAWAGLRSEVCYRCNGTGAQVIEDTEWFIVECKGYRFHTRGGARPDVLRRLAVSVAPHNPTQPAREIPDDIPRRLWEPIIQIAMRRFRALDRRGVGSAALD